MKNNATFLQYLREFNSKERFYLVRQIFGNPEFTPSPAFVDSLARMFNLQISGDIFSAIDYHLDWLYAGLQLYSETNLNNVYPNYDQIVKGQQEDMDFILALEVENNYHIILIEAKGVTGWNNDQMKHKKDRLKAIFGEDGKRWPGVIPHFVILSPSKPSKKLDITGWPKWMLQDGEVVWIQLKIQPGLKYVTRWNNKTGKSDKNGRCWTVTPRKYYSCPK